MNKLHLLQLDNGYTWDDHDIEVIGVYLTEEDAVVAAATLLAEEFEEHQNTRNFCAITQVEVGKHIPADTPALILHWNWGYLVTKRVGKVADHFEPRPF